MSNLSMSAQYKQLCHELIDTWDWAVDHQSKEFAQFLIDQLRNDLQSIEEQLPVPARSSKTFYSRVIYREVRRVRRNKLNTTTKP